MPIVPIMPLSGMNKEFAYSRFKKGQYTDALDITAISEKGNSTSAIHPIIGNKKAYNIPVTSAQNKIYRILTPGTNNPITTFHLFFKNENNFLFADATVSILETKELTNNNFISGITTAINNPLGNFPVQAFNIISAIDKSYIDLELTGVLGFEYIITIDPSVISIIPNDFKIIIKQESYDSSLSGYANIIGDYKLLNDLFIWSTTAKKISSKIDNFTIEYFVTSDGNNEIRLGVSNNTWNILNISVGYKIQISNYKHSDVNGIWILKSINDAGGGFTDIILANSYSIIPDDFIPGNCEITINIDGLGELGIAQKNINNDTWTYIRLLKSKAWNFRLPKQITGNYVEKTGDNVSFYWTDYFNFPRVAYLKENYKTDGLLSINGGEYDYDTINNETKLFISAIGIKLEFSQQLDTGGTLLSGNKRYSVAFVGQGEVTTQYTDLTNPIPVYKSVSTEHPGKIVGDVDGTKTSKINILKVSGIIPGLFKSLQLICIEYFNNFSKTILVKTVELGNETEILIQHTGQETNTEIIDVGKLGTTAINYVRARSMSVIDNRMELSDVSSSKNYDLSEFATQIKYKIKRKEINSVGNINNPLYEEYLRPDNINKNMGYCHKETYRISCKLRHKGTDVYTPNYWVDDISIENTVSGRRIEGLPDFNLTNSDGTKVYIPYIEFSNMDFNFVLPDGLRIKDVFDQIIFERAEVIPEVLASGALLLTELNYDGSASSWHKIQNHHTFKRIKFTYTQDQFPPPTSFILGEKVESNFASGIIVEVNVTNIALIDVDGTFNNGDGIEGDESGATGTINSAPVTFDYSSYPISGNKHNGTLDRFGLFHSPQHHLGNIDLSFVAGDKFYYLGQPDVLFSPDDNRITDFKGYFGTGISFNSTDIEDSKFLDSGFLNSVLLNNSITGQKTIFNSAPALSGTAQDTYKGFAISFKDQITKPLTNNTTFDAAIYYGIYFRPLIDKYGDKETTKYITCGHFHDISDSDSVATTTDVFGGDVFTQKNYIHSHQTIDVFKALGSGYGFYTQNRVNEQLRTYDNNNLTAPKPHLASNIYMWAAGYPSAFQQTGYNRAYNIRNDEQKRIAFNPKVINITDNEVRIIWSEIKIISSVFDNYRIYLPLNFRDLNLAFGSITHHLEYNGELLTFQKKKIQRHYFNTRGILQTSSDLSVLIGDGSVMSRDGQTITTIGCNNKFSIIKGLSKGGNDVLYWVDTYLKKILRLGFDGTRSISDEWDMRSFIANNINWVDNKDNPASGEGICGIFNQRNGDVIFTFRGHKEVAYWLNNNEYLQNDEVYLSDENNFTTFEKTNEIYIVKINHTSSETNKPGTGSEWETYWTRILHNNPDYYNEYTLVLNEYENVFKGFYTPKPKIYIKYGNGYLTPRPISDTGEVYEHNTGKKLIWYDDGITKQESMGYIEMVFANDENLTKEFLSVAIASKIVPKKIEYTTKNHKTFSIDTDFEDMNGEYMAAIMNDIITSSDGNMNTEDTTHLFGKYLKIKFYFEKDVEQELLSLYLKFNSIARVYQT